MIGTFVASLLAVAAAGLYRHNRDSDEVYDDLCPCFHSYQPLDTRWFALRRAVSATGEELSWDIVSEIVSAVGRLFGWFVGRPFLRVPLDEGFYDRLRLNCQQFGCIGGARWLVDVAVPAAPAAEGAAPVAEDAAPATEKWCPTRARQSCKVRFEYLNTAAG